MRQLAITLFLSLCGLSMTALADEEGTIKYRQALMKSIGGHTSALALIGKKQVAYGDHSSAHAQSLQAMAMLVKTAFADQTSGESRAKESVWSDKAGFDDAATALEKATQNLAAATEGQGDVGAAMKELFGACKECHKDYRVKKDDLIQRTDGWATKAAVAAFVALIGFSVPQVCVGQSAESQSVSKGEYVMRAAGCAACHTVADDDKGFLAGGRALDTPFGRFHTPNITPDPETGIGRWSADDFWRALSEGRGPDGRHYYPAFPYPTYTRMRREDADALYAYLMSVTPVVRRNKEHDLVWYASVRIANRFWKWMFLDERRFEDDPSRSAQENRGAYLVEALAHCGECHTPRGWLGALDRDAWLAGNPDGPEGDPVPNITPHESGIGQWSNSEEIEEYLASGMDPDGDFAGSAMVEVVDDSTAYLSNEDRAAIAVYLKSLPPLPD